MTTHPHDSAAKPVTVADTWHYAIQYGPEGEANYAWVYRGKEMVATMKTHHAVAVVAALSASPNAIGAGTVKVRDLEWEGHWSKSIVSDDLRYRVHFCSDGSDWGFPEYKRGYYAERAVGFGKFVSGPHETMAEAKAAAQADYETRILSAISPAPGNGEAAEAVAWVFELARARNRETGEYSNWGAPQISFSMPCVPECSVRNLRPLQYKTEQMAGASASKLLRRMADLIDDMGPNDTIDALVNGAWVELATVEEIRDAAYPKTTEEPLR